MVSHRNACSRIESLIIWRPHRNILLSWEPLKRCIVHDTRIQENGMNDLENKHVLTRYMIYSSHIRKNDIFQETGRPAQLENLLFSSVKFQFSCTEHISIRLLSLQHFTYLKIGKIGCVDNSTTQLYLIWSSRWSTKLSGTSRTFTWGYMKNT